MSGTGGGNRDRACIHVSVVSLCADSELRSFSVGDRFASRDYRYLMILLRDINRPNNRCGLLAFYRAVLCHIVTGQFAERKYDSMKERSGVLGTKNAMYSRENSFFSFQYCCCERR